MKLGHGFHVKVDMLADERVLLVARCSEVFGDRLLSMVGDEVFVTSRHVVFTPNYLGFALGHRPWSWPIEEVVGATTEMIKRPHVGMTDGVRLVLRVNGEGESERKTFWMAQRADAAEFPRAVERARY